MVLAHRGLGNHTFDRAKRSAGSGDRIFFSRIFLPACCFLFFPQRRRRSRVSVGTLGFSSKRRSSQPEGPGTEMSGHPTNQDLALVDRKMDRVK
jgi:hypothetical protein